MLSLRDKFGNKLISKGAEFRWTLNSPDLDVADFFLWVYLKSHVYKESPNDIQQLKHAVEDFMRVIPVEM